VTAEARKRDDLGLIVLLQTFVLFWLFSLVLPGITVAAAFSPIPMIADPHVNMFRVKAAQPLDRLMAAESQPSAFIINYLSPGSGRYGDTCAAWPAGAQAAFSYAAGIWQSRLNTTVPIVIDVCWATNLSAGVLGHGGYLNSFSNFTNAPQAATEYPVALANSLAGTDLDPGTADIYIAFSNGFSWYYGTDGNTPDNNYDLASVALHEIGHGIGFIGSMDVSGEIGSYFSPEPLIYDRFTQNGSAQALLSFPNNSASLALQLKSNNLYFSGTNANAANGGSPVKIYAPAAWSDGSSYSHLDEIYNNTENALMTYSLSFGESIHDPGPVTLGMLRDMGWQLLPRTLSVAITGNGSVNSSPSGIACAAGKPANCSYQFPVSQLIDLTPSASSDSMFMAWTGGCTSVTGEICSIRLDADKSATATFAILPPVFSGGSYYESLQTAYDAAALSPTIMAKAVELPAGDLTLNMGKTVLLKGGYDSSYGSNSGGATTMAGILTLVTGSLTLEDLIIK
jgi:hypothetical protein